MHARLTQTYDSSKWESQNQIGPDTGCFIVKWSIGNASEDKYMYIFLGYIEIP